MRNIKKQNWTKNIGIGVGLILVIYFAFAIYFINHFFFGSVINGVNYSGKTVAAVEKSIANKIDAYELELIERGDNVETIYGEDFNMVYVPDGTVKKLKKEQNPFNWLFGSISRDTHEMVVTVSYDKKALNKTINNLRCFSKHDLVAPEDAFIQYNKDKYEIVPEVYGNHVDKRKLVNSIKEALVSGDTTLNLEEADCYVMPKIKQDNQRMKEALNTLNGYIKTQITYDFADRTEFVDKELIHTWLEWDDDFNVTINDDSLINFIKSLEAKYNTLGKPRIFTTTANKTIQVPSGNYGWMIRRGEEKEELIKNIKEQKVIKREPVYAQRGYTRLIDDIGNTYVEISLKHQYMWFYKDGVKLVKTKVVTGNVALNFGTPVGVYGITYKERNATLNGENYSSPVSYWLPFNGNIGIHDATWRSKFGGDIYKTSGSHGCVNTPYKHAQTIFENIEANVPVIVY